MTTAENGEKALAILEQNADSIAGIMLDLVMPVMDGFAFLQQLSINEKMQNIPVIVSTGNNDRENEKKALRLGAWDFVSKPYDADIIRFRLKNAITRSRLSAFEQLKYLAEFDTLTDIYNKNKFFDKVSAMLRGSSVGEFAFIRFDIDRFQLVNAFFGTREGNNVLQYIARIIAEYGKNIEDYAYGRMDSDVFALLLRNRGEETAEDFSKYIRAKLKAYPLYFDLVPTIGVYIIDEPEIKPVIMLDRATLASKQVKGSYMQSYAFYTPEMGQKIAVEQEITNEMSTALSEEQFVVYLQPKYDLRTEKSSGAEALVRWKHPQRGMISPGEFIPVFERNGFITELDFYVWEKVCAMIKKWKELGWPLHPVSVNVSRGNIYKQDLVERLCALTDKYGVPRSLLHLEVTESAYTENADILHNMINELHSCGFTIMMDDFGSGYSSLNVLKDIEVDILKIDMRFLSDTENKKRSDSIITFVVDMAKRLEISTVAEGVEKREQVEFLRGAGCDYVQGYYFARPMPSEEYEKLICEEINGR